jgi:NAD(P)-dependent dehydrogenase (short-subunit alcohol dehydrogenase family)
MATRFGPRLAGKVAIVTGGGGGLGRAQCIRLAEEGAAVSVWDINQTTGQGTADLLAHQIDAEEIESLGVRFDQVDVTDEAAIAAAMESISAEFGGIDVMVNNHAHFIFKTIEDTTSEDWDAILGVNIKGGCPFTLTASLFIHAHCIVVLTSK